MRMSVRLQTELVRRDLMPFMTAMSFEPKSQSKGTEQILSWLVVGPVKTLSSLDYGVWIGSRY
jgi:hypothetical protein